MTTDERFSSFLVHPHAYDDRVEGVSSGDVEALRSRRAINLRDKMGQSSRSWVERVRPADNPGSTVIRCRTDAGTHFVDDDSIDSFV
jgi:hypothetical protein